MSEVLAVIPARGGSKGIPGKNLRMIAGRSLVAHAVDHALRATSVDAVVVSTDAEEIADAAKAAGADVVERPAGLATDLAPTLPVIQHAVEAWSAARTSRHPSLPLVIVTLQPTSPLRRPEHIDRAIALLDDPWDAVVTVCEVEHSPYKMFQLEGEALRPLLADAEPGAPRQSLPSVYRENGAVYVTHRSVLFGTEGGSLRGERTRASIMAPEDSIDIDTPWDLVLAETLLAERIH